MIPTTAGSSTSRPRARAFRDKTPRSRGTCCHGTTAHRRFARRRQVQDDERDGAGDEADQKGSG